MHTEDAARNAAEMTVIPYAVQPIRACGSFEANCFAVRRKKLDSSLEFHCQDLTGQRGSITAIEFSFDGTLLASGGQDKVVRLWPIRNVPIEMETRHISSFRWLAISSDNGRLFSGEHKGKVFIHDIVT